MATMKCEKFFSLTTGDLDNYDRLRPYAILDLFQEIAGVHAEQLNLGYQDMLDKNCAWVITKNKYHVYHYPKTSETIKVLTWPALPGRIDYDRNYQIYDSENNLLVDGVSKWCLIDITTRKLYKSSTPIYGGEFYSDENFNIEFVRMPNLAKEKLDYLFTHTVRASNLDHYQHMNNAKYAELVLDALELTQNQEIVELQINNQHEAKVGQRIDVYKKVFDDQQQIFGYLEDGNISFSAYVKIKG